MARKQSGGLNKFLNFIGLVDDDNPRDTYGEEYQSGKYGRQSAYVPARQQRTAGRRAQTSREEPRQRLSGGGQRGYGDDRYGGARSGSASGGTRGTAGYDDYRAQNRQPSRFEDPVYGYDPRTPRTPRYPENGLVQAQPPARMRVSPRSRTVMYSLHSLEDCCEVIDQLIANNTVVLTMEELDGRLMQRAVDTLSGAVFALHASIRKASDKTYLVAPMSVEVNEAYDVDRTFR